MSRSDKPAIPIACDMSVFSPEEREAHVALVETRFKPAVSSAEDLPDGLRLGIRPDANNVAMLAEFVEGERRCCPFFEFTIRLEPGGDALWLDLTGAEGAGALVREELGGLS